MLTPIRVRGHKRPRWTPEDGTPKPIPSGPKGGRPMLSIEAKCASSQLSQRNKRARLLIASANTAHTQKKTLSRLEKLPAELIEKIFLYSLNVNFPRAARSLASVVSSERTYRALLLLAFWGDSSSGTLLSTSSSAITPVSPASFRRRAEITRILRPLDYSTPLSEDERRALQKSLFPCRWCTIPRLLNQLPDLMRLNAQRHWFGTGILIPADQEDRLNLFLTEQEQQEDTPAVTAIFEGTDCTNEDISYTLSVTPQLSLTITTATQETGSPPLGQETRHIFSILSVPDSLLKGSTTKGFTPRHNRLLEILRISSGFAQPDLATNTTSVTFSREALQHGIHTALISNNHTALTTLLKIDEYVFRSQNTTNTGVILPYSLPPEHFHTAIRMARSDPSFFQSLLRASAESMPADDPEITQWAMDLNDAFGSWLLDFMLVLPRQRETAGVNPVDGSIFYMGRANAQLGMASRYLGEVLGVEELGGWMEESFLLPS